MRFAKVSIILALAGFTCGSFSGRERVFAEKPDSSLDEPIDAAWRHLLSRNEPEVSSAVLHLSRNPAETTGFLTERLRPLHLSSDRIETLLDSLQSSDDDIWRPAFQELGYFDPRLALSIEELIAHDSMQESPGRHRLVSILIGTSIKNIAKWKYIRLHEVGDGFNFCCSDNPDTCGANYWGEPNMRFLCGITDPKPEWSRALRAIALLEHFGTPEAMKIIQRMSTGHPDAQPTIFARSILAKHEVAEP